MVGSRLAVGWYEVVGGWNIHYVVDDLEKHYKVLVVAVVLLSFKIRC